MTVNDWELRESAYGVWHVLPRGDLRDHDAADCWCSPDEDEGVVVHNSMDLRESYENGRSAS